MPSARAITLESPVTALSGVGPERAAQLARLKIVSVQDLLFHRPRRYEDRRHLCPIADLELGRAAATRGAVVAMGINYYRKRTKSVFEIILEDGTARLHCRWWNLPFMEHYFKVGDEVTVFGKPVSLKPRTIDHPETEVTEAGEERSVHMDRIAPVYPLTEGLPQRWLRSLIWRTLALCEAQIQELWPTVGMALDPQTVISRASNPPQSSSRSKCSERRFAATPSGEKAGLVLSRRQAVRWLHFPEELAQAERAREQLALDEFIELQLVIQRRRKNLQSKARALPCKGDNRFIKPFLHQLGFSLTTAQTRVLREIRGDMAGACPMRRLLQGDVGSGKTVVAACTALMTIESGFNVAFMAPTEILAEQHYRNFSRWFQPLGIPVELRTGGRKTASSPTALNDGNAQSALSLPARTSEQTRVMVGTHALIEQGFTMERLGLVIIDEQHKFGVAQREKLVRKGRYPHLLVMTATPIPRTLGLTLYGDLDLSTIDEMPAGRGRTGTFVRATDALPKVWEFVRKKLVEGRQVYVVYPRVEDAGAIAGTVKAVTQEFDRLQQTLAPFKVGLLHGRLAIEAKEAVMAGFRANRIHVLLATSVVEVGVDVPNATVMVIENAEQFGLAQLHQLRGRIGRGAHESFCILIAAAKTPEARERLRVLAETTDGFRIAEADLKLRGPGELVGQEQSGLADFKFGNLAEDLQLVERAREIAREILLVS